MSLQCPPAPDIGPNIVVVLLALIAALGSIASAIKSHQTNQMIERGKT